VKALLLALLLLPGIALAQDVRTFTWQTPTQYADGSALPSSAIEGFRFGCSPQSGRYDALTFEVAGGTATSHQIPAQDFPLGDALDWLRPEVTEFDGAMAGVDSGFALQQLAGRSFTLQANARYDGSLDLGWTALFGSTSTTNTLFIGKRPDSGDLMIWIGGLGSYTISDSSLFDGADRHLAIVFDSTANELRVFVDYALVSTHTGVTGTLASTGNLLLGGVGHATDQLWTGAIYGVSVNAPGAGFCAARTVAKGLESDWSVEASWSPAPLEPVEPEPLPPAAPTDLRIER